MNAVQKAVETRRLYRFETIFMPWHERPYLSKPRSPAYLRRLAARVWEKHGRAGLPVPVVEIKPSASYSYCEGYSRIELATDGTKGMFHHDTILVLLHELTHSIGYCNHGRAFARKYADLLVEYGKCDAGELDLAMSLFKVKH